MSKVESVAIVSVAELKMSSTHSVVSFICGSNEAILVFLTRDFQDQTAWVLRPKLFVTLYYLAQLQILLFQNKTIEVFKWTIRTDDTQGNSSETSFEIFEVLYK